MLSVRRIRENEAQRARAERGCETFVGPSNAWSSRFFKLNSWPVPMSRRGER